MKVLQVMPDFGMAGAENMCVNLCLELIKRKDCEVRVISFYNIRTHLIDKLEKNNIKIYFLDKEAGLQLNVFFKIRKIIREYQPDVIHSHRYSLAYLIPSTLFIKNKFKMIHTIHSLASKDAGVLLRSLQGIYFRCGIITPVSISEEVTKSIKDVYKLEDKYIRLIYNGIDLNNCKEKKIYDMNGNILHIGRFNKEKNHKALISQFKIVSRNMDNIKLKLIGEGELKREIIEQVSTEDLKDRVEFLGIINNVYPYLNNTDIFVLPSLYEGMPITIIEAMGTGVPIIAKAVGGITNMITNGVNGVLVNDDEELAREIIHLLNDKELRESLGRNAIIESKKFSSENMANKYVDAYLAK